MYDSPPPLIFNHQLTQPTARPAWEEDVTFSNRKHPGRTRITETTTIRSRHSHSRPPSPPSPAPLPIEAPPPPPPRPITPVSSPKPTIVHAPTPPPRIELVSVEEDAIHQIHTSKKSRRSSHGSSSHGGRDRDREEVYIERERQIERRRTPVEQYDTYRYVPGVVSAPPQQQRQPLEDYYGRYEDSPRVSVNRITERERVSMDERERVGRRDYYRGR